MQPCRTPSGAGARTVDNLAIARLLGEIADLLEIKAENPFKIRAYRNASDSVAAAAERLSDLDEPRLLQIPGIGRDLAKKVREIAETGGAEYHRELLAEFPPTLLDLMRLQGVGPRTVRQLHAQLGINTLDDLEAASRRRCSRRWPITGAMPAAT
jgi:DNA polymerase (family 10)